MGQQPFFGDIYLHILIAKHIKINKQLTFPYFLTVAN